MGRKRNGARRTAGMGAKHSHGKCGLRVTRGKGGGMEFSSIFDFVWILEIDNMR